MQSRFMKLLESSVHGENRRMESIILLPGAQGRKIRSSGALLDERSQRLTSNSVNSTVDLRKRSQGVGSKNWTPRNYMATNSRCLNQSKRDLPNRECLPMIVFNREQGFTARVSPSFGFMDVIFPCYQPQPSTSISTTNNQISFFSQQDKISFLVSPNRIFPTVRVEEKEEVLNRFFFHLLINQPRTTTTNSTTTLTNTSTTNSIITTTTTSNTTSRRNIHLN